MDPLVWGPVTWRVLHEASFMLCAEDCITLFKCMRHLIPCQHCANSYAHYLTILPPDKLVSAEKPLSAEKWLWTIHDMVNQKLGRPCPAFSVLCDRSRLQTRFADRWDFVDAMLVMAVRISTDAAAASYAHVVELLRKALELRDMRTHSWLTAVEVVSPATAWVHAHDCRNCLLKECGLPSCSRESTRARFKKDEKPADKAVKPKTRNPRLKRRGQ